MRKLLLPVGALSLYAMVLCTATQAAPLLSPGDFIIAIDTDPPHSLSNYPAAESPAKVIDGDINFKYLNFAKERSGFIVTPLFGSTTIQSMYFVSGNDAPERDPASWALYGTNDPITSLDNSTGDAENWTLISQADVAMPDARNEFSPLIAFSNSTPYTSYRLHFPTLKNTGAANSMQIDDVYMYQSTDGTGQSFLSAADPILAVHIDGAPDSRYPIDQEFPAQALDGDFATKYLNFGKQNSGFIVTPAGGTSVVTSFQITTANDFPVRDPSTWKLYGTNDTVLSQNNSQGDGGENWVLIDEGSITLPVERGIAGGEVVVDNTTAYKSYRMIFPTTVDNGPAVYPPDSMQIADIQFFGTFGAGAHAGDFDSDGDVDGADFVAWQTNFPKTTGATLAQGDADNDGDVDGADFVVWQTNFPFSPSPGASPVPEPASWAVLLFGCLAASGIRRHRRRSVVGFPAANAET